MKQLTRHRFRLSARTAGDVRGLIFSCPCGFEVLQLPVGETYPAAFVRAVNEHLRAIAVEDGPATHSHLTLAP